MNLENTHLYTLHIPDAGSGWELIMQSGVAVACMVGVSLKRLLEEEFALPADLLARIDVLLLDGKPVDTPAETIVRNGVRLAMAAGLPGIAGLSMRSGSAVRGLRPGITHAQAQDPQQVLGDRLRQGQSRADGQGLIEVAAGQAHRLASSSAAAVAWASSASCA